MSKEEAYATTKEKQFGKLRLSVLGTVNGSGFDILYDFGKSHEFVEFRSKPEFLFIQPWMQFPSREYSEECKLVSIELVSRFNRHDELVRENEALRKRIQVLESRQDLNQGD